MKKVLFYKAYDLDDKGALSGQEAIEEAGELFIKDFNKSHDSLPGFFDTVVTEFDPKGVNSVKVDFVMN